MRKSQNQLLREEVTRLSQSVEYFKGQISVLEEKASKVDRLNSDRVDMFQAEVRKEKCHNEQLLEVIRWHINPGTAQYPFRLEKGQRDERDNHGRF